MKSKIILPGKHIFLTSANEIDEICKPLKEFGINHFVYVKSFNDGSHINLCNRPQWTDFFYNQCAHEKALFEGSQNLYQSGYTLWCSLPRQDIFCEAKSYFRIDHGITIIKKHDDCCEFFYFGTTENNPSLNNFYLNNIDLLDRFILYFRNMARGIIKKSTQSKICICRRDDQIIEDLKIIYNNFTLDNGKRRQYIQATSLKKYYFANARSEFTISNKELICILLLLKGKSAKEIARELFLSQRTVEHHLDNLKSKLNCLSKSELIPKLLQMGLRFSCDKKGTLFLAD